MPDTSAGLAGLGVYPRNVRLGIGSGGYSAGVVALSSEVAAGFSFEASEGFLARRFGWKVPANSMDTAGSSNLGCAGNSME